MELNSLRPYLEKIKDIFKNESDRYKAHEKCQNVLKDMSLDKEVLYDIIRQNLDDADFLRKKRHYSTLAMKIYENEDFSFVLNIFPPLPNKDLNISFQSIHHHGSLILSTVSAFGPGYKSILFKKGFEINPSNLITKMSIEKEYQNEVHDVSFIDAFQPHIVFYPNDFSGTYALWSNRKKSAKEIAKKIGLINSFKKPLAKIINLIGLSRIFGLNVAEYYDFYVKNNEVIAMKEREAYNSIGSNENFIQNICCFIQKTGFDDLDFLNRVIQKNDTRDSTKKYLTMLIENQKVTSLFHEGHLNIPKVNLHRNEILGALNN